MIRNAWLTILLVVMLAATASADKATVVKYRGEKPHLTQDEIVVILKNVAMDLTLSTGIRHGLLRKGFNSCNGYACDIICQGDLIQFDVAIDSDPLTGRWDPQWDYVTTPAAQQGCEFVSPAPPTPPTPTPTPVPSIDLTGVYDRLATIEAKLDAHAASLEEHRAEARKAKTRAEAILTSSKTWIAGGSLVAGWLIKHFSAKSSTTAPQQ